MAYKNQKSAEELAKEMDRACVSPADMTEEELIEYDAQYGYDYHED